MGRGKSKPKKITPKRRPPKKKKRQLPEGLRRWNQVRSYISKENKKTGKKYNGVELNALTKSFLLEYFDTDFSQKDIEKYIELEVPNFYSNALDIDASLLTPIKYFQIDARIRELPTGLLVVVDANGFGKVDIKTSEYDYHASGLRDVVENIRLEAQESYEGYEFRGNIIKNDRPARKKNEEPEYLVLFVLFVDGLPVVDTRGIEPLAPAPPTEKAPEESEIEKQKKRVEEKEKKQREGRKKKAAEAAIQGKSEQERLLELQNENLRLQSEKAKNILALIKAGYTKEEIKAMGL